MVENNYSKKNYLILSFIFIVASFLLLKSFFFGIIWGIVVAVAIWPVGEFISSKNYKFFNKGTENHALIYTLLFMVFFLAPILYSFGQITVLYELISNYISSHTDGGVFKSPEWFSKIPMGLKLIKFWDDNIATSQGILNLVSQINTNQAFHIVLSIWGELFDRVLTITVMIVTLYFTLKNGRKIQQNYRQVIHYWFGQRSLLHLDSGVMALRGTINGIILVGVAEGVLLAIPLVMGGIESGLIIGLIAGIAGVIPLLMPALILPFLAYMFFTNNVFWAVVGLIVLVIVWFVFENIIKPQMISKTVKVNSLLILVAMIGGMQLLGLVGLFVGPAIVAMTIGMVTELLQEPVNAQKQQEN